MGKVFSVTDFKEGLDVRKTALTAPGGTLRILDNAVITPGGEIEKRFAFVPVCTMPDSTSYIFGHGGSLHIFTLDTVAVIDPGTCPVPIVLHAVFWPPDDPNVGKIIDVEAFDDGFYVIGQNDAGTSYIWWADERVLEADVSFSHGTYARTYKTKMYRADGNYLRFSGVSAPSVNDPASTDNPGAGFIDVAVNDPDGETVQSLEIFYNWMAVFSRLTTQIWNLDPDPTLDKLQQVLRIGTVAPHSALQFGTGDVLFLSDSGVRSLKALTVSLAASVSDVGSAIDPLMIAAIRSQPDAVKAAQAVVQPISGRYWLSIGDYIYVLSYFPAGDITAWSRFVPGFPVQEFAIVDNRVFARGPAPDNLLYLYGGVDYETYDSSPVTVRTPHMSMDDPTGHKRIKSVDVMCEGAWSVSIGMLPNNLDAFELCANISNNTFGLQSIPFAGYGTHFGLELVCSAPGPATLAAIHLNIQEGVTK